MDSDFYTEDEWYYDDWQAPSYAPFSQIPPMYLPMMGGYPPMGPPVMLGGYPNQTFDADYLARPATLIERPARNIAAQMGPFHSGATSKVASAQRGSASTPVPQKPTAAPEKPKSVEQKPPERPVKSTSGSLPPKNPQPPMAQKSLSLGAPPKSPINLIPQAAHIDFQLPCLVNLDISIPILAAQLKGTLRKMKDSGVPPPILQVLEEFIASKTDPILLSSSARNFVTKILGWFGKLYSVKEDRDILTHLKTQFIHSLNYSKPEKDWGAKWTHYMLALRGLANIGQHPEMFCKLSPVDVLYMYLCVAQISSVSVKLLYEFKFRLTQHNSIKELVLKDDPLKVLPIKKPEEVVLVPDNIVEAQQPVDNTEPSEAIPTPEPTKPAAAVPKSPDVKPNIEAAKPAANTRPPEAARTPEAPRITKPQEASPEPSRHQPRSPIPSPSNQDFPPRRVPKSAAPITTPPPEPATTRKSEPGSPSSLEKNGKRLLPKNVFYRYRIDIGQSVTEKVNQVLRRQLLKEICVYPLNTAQCMFEAGTLVSAIPLPAIDELPWSIIFSFHDEDYTITLVSVEGFRNPTLAEAMNLKDPSLYDPTFNKKKSLKSRRTSRSKK